MINAEPIGLYGVTIYHPVDIKDKKRNDWTYENSRYFIGVPSTSPQGKFEEYIIPAFTWAVFPGKSFFSEENITLDERIHTEWLPTSGYEFIEGVDIHFLLPNHIDLENFPFEIWIPVVKKDRTSI